VRLGYSPRHASREQAQREAALLRHAGGMAEVAGREPRPSAGALGGLLARGDRAARAKWDDTRSSGYSYETARPGLDAAALSKVSANAKARRFWAAQAPYYRRIVGHWAMSAKRPATRASRLATLIDCCARGIAIPPLANW
jgi:hypothetical protein